VATYSKKIDFEIYIYIFIINSIMDRKTLMAYLSAGIILMVGFGGLIYYNPAVHDNKIQTHELGHYIREYYLKELGNVSHKSTFRTESSNVAGVKAINNTIRMNYTFYMGSNNVTGELLNVYLNGKLIHRSLLINSTKLNGNITIIPLYSLSGNYNTITLFNSANSKNKKGTGGSYVYVNLKGIYSWGTNGNALAFTQDMTDLLLSIMAAGIPISALASVGILSVVFAVGASTIGLYDAWGGDNGVFFFSENFLFFAFAWINSPYNHVPSYLRDDGSYPLTVYNGELP